MTETKTNLFKKGTKCQICTGCGRCFPDKPMDVVNSFRANAADKCGHGYDTESEKVREKEYAITADIGTTTIAMQLRRNADGTVLGNFTAINPQRQYGADVLSRIEAAREPAAGKGMQEAVMTVLKQGIDSLLLSQSTYVEKTLAASVAKESIPVGKVPDKTSCRLLIAANTTMVHLLMGYETAGLGRYPFTAERLDEIRTELFGIETVILPGMSAFVGGDITAGIAALSMHKRKEITLLLDLGTNGEIALGNKDKFLCTSTAAGPAFEGSMEAYGTDMMSLVAKLVQEGIVDETGLLAKPYFEEGITIGGVCVTQTYIRSLQVAKAAVCTGISMAAKKYGLTDLNQIDKVFLAGGMGYYLNPRAAARIGLLPVLLAEKTVAVGNAALEGAFCYQSTEMAGVLEKCELFNLAEEENFADAYIENMFLIPYTDKL